MNERRDPDTILAAWLDDGPTDLPDVTRRAILTALPTTPQARRGLLAPRRFFQMNSTARLALGALVAVIALGGALYLLGPRPASGPGGPAPTPTILPALGPLDTATWTTYTSNRYGFSIAHPANWTARPSDHAWALPADADWQNTASEGFIAPGQTILVSAWSAAVVPGTTAEAWIVSYCLRNQVTTSDPVPCDRLGPGGPRLMPVTVDGHAGSLVRFTNDTQAFILVGNRMYVVACWRPETEASVLQYGGVQRLLEGYLSTMHLLVGGPAPSESASPRP